MFSLYNNTDIDVRTKVADDLRKTTNKLNPDSELAYKMARFVEMLDKKNFKIKKINRGIK